MENKTKVIIVDDNKEFCQLIADYFEEKDDIELIGIAYNGVDCLELLREKKPDVLVLDLIMPKLDGIGVMEEIKKLGIHNDFKTIILTALGQEDVTHQVVELGANYYIMKPFDLEKLVTRINQLMNPPAGTSGGSVVMNSSQKPKTENVELKITEIMHQLGVPPHLKGYLYLREAIKLVIEDMGLVGAVTKKLYPEVADNFDSTPSRVERAIRHAIEVTWNKGNMDALNDYFGSTASAKSGKATNSQFIARIADNIRLEI